MIPSRQFGSYLAEVDALNAFAAQCGAHWRSRAGLTCSDYEFHNLVRCYGFSRHDRMRENRPVYCGLVGTRNGWDKSTANCCASATRQNLLIIGQLSGALIDYERLEESRLPSFRRHDLSPVA